MSVYDLLSCNSNYQLHNVCFYNIRYAFIMSDTRLGWIYTLVAWMSRNSQFKTGGIYWNSNLQPLINYGVTNFIALHFSSSEIMRANVSDLNPFDATDLFWNLLKTSENQRFSDVFRDYQKRSAAWNGLKVAEWIFSTLN